MRKTERPWDDGDTVKLAGMYFSTPKPSIDEMSAAMGRTPNAVWQFITRIGMSAPGAKLRRCLPCNCKFFSSHPGNRICSRCAGSELMRCA